MALEAARLLEKMGCDVRVYDPQGLPVKDEISVEHHKVQELRQLSEWSEAQFWCSPEQHGNITAVMKNQSKSDSGLHELQAYVIVDWIPLSIGSVRPTQGKVLGFAQVGDTLPAFISGGELTNR
jgi:arsenic resistance protein ArsH